MSRHCSHAMLLRLLDGDEWVGGTKQPYDQNPFVLIRDAYIDANPENKTSFMARPCFK